MVSINTVQASSTGDIVFEESSDSWPVSDPSRISRTRNLDGTASLVHSGFSHGDRTFDIIAGLDQDQEELLRFIQQNYTLVELANKTGKYLGAIDNLQTGTGLSRIRFLVKEKVSE